MGRIARGTKRRAGLAVACATLAATVAVGTAGPAAARYRPNPGEYLAFASTRDGNPEVYVMRADGTDQTRLTAHSGDDIPVGWAPDGRTIIFRTNRDGNGDIYTVDRRTGDLRALTSGPADDVPVDVSPRGDVLFGRDGDLYTINVDGSGLRRLTATPGTEMPTGFTPNGGKVLYATDEGGTPTIWSISRAGRGAKRIATDATAVTSSRRNRLLAVCRNEGDRVCIMRTTNGKKLQYLTDAGATDVPAGFNSEAKRIAFTTDRDGNREVYVMNLDGSAPKNVTNDPGDDQAIGFAPTGNGVLFVTDRNGNRDLYTVSSLADELVALRLTDSAGDDYGAIYSP